MTIDAIPHPLAQTGRTLRLSPAETLLTRREAANFLGIRENTLAVWACTRRYPLPVVKVGRLAKYRLSDLQHFIATNMHGVEA